MTSSFPVPGTAPPSARSRPHARLLAIELDPEVDWSGVVVVTAADIPGENLVSAIKEDQPVLVPIGGEIRHHSEPVALLAGPDQEIVRRLKSRIRLVTEALVPVFDPEASDHVFASYDIGTADLADAFARADVILEGEYRVGHQEQLYIENNAMIAVPAEDGGIAVHGSLQCPYYVHRALHEVARAERGAGAGDRRPRRAVASAARRSTRRSSPSTRRSSPESAAGRCG